MTGHAAATRLPRAYRVLVLLFLDWLLQSADAMGCRANSVGRAFCAVDLLRSRLTLSAVAVGCCDWLSRIGWCSCCAVGCYGRLLLLAVADRLMLFLHSGLTRSLGW